MNPQRIHTFLFYLECKKQMSFNRLNYDTCTYKHTLRQSVGPGDYMTTLPNADCDTCFPVDNQQVKNMSMNYFGNKAVDISSDLMGITRKATNCPDNKFVPNTAASYGEPQHFKDCATVANEHTRVSNPPCTLRSSGWNRFDWLCRNPQDTAIAEFDFNISNRIIAKDNHRPLIQRPLDQTAALPLNHNGDDVYSSFSTCMKNGTGAHAISEPSTTWKGCNYYDKYAL